MIKYKVRIAKTAEKQLRRLPSKYKDRIGLALLELAENPLPFGVKKLTGTESTYRIRVADYRIIYDLEHKVLTILVLKIGHRRDIYR